MDFNFDIIRVKGYNCPIKYLLMVNGVPMLFANSEYRLKNIISYIGGDDSIRTSCIPKAIKRLRELYKKAGV